MQLAIAADLDRDFGDGDAGAPFDIAGDENCVRLLIRDEPARVNHRWGAVGNGLLVILRPPLCALKSAIHPKVGRSQKRKPAVSALESA